MKCLSCQSENKDSAGSCRKCGADLSVKPLWQPSWRWHIKVLSIIYILLAVSYFAISGFLSRAPEPYRLRERPPEVLPWMK